MTSATKPTLSKQNSHPLTQSIRSASAMKVEHSHTAAPGGQTMSVKLTAAQKRAYALMIENGRFQFASGYKPAEALAEKGLAKLTRGSFGLCYIEPVTEAQSDV